MANTEIITLYVSTQLKGLMDKAKDVIGESRSSFIRDSVKQRLERLGVIQEELQKELK